ncbi:MAG: hypothetical protein ABS81_02830 [Pseudonocardia sp. SCN 72-86]|nr:MAG: hypothetical protein ABS81_02830 [Pseudonocardia sp. SCN 72-86]
MPSSDDHAGQPVLAVVGAGLAGLVAGVRAAELGVRVVVLESGSAQRYPSNSRYTGGVFHLAFHDITAPPDDLFEALSDAAAGFSDPSLLRVLADDAARCIEWLTAHGAEFGQGGSAEWMSRMLVPFSLQTPGFRDHWPDKGAERLLQCLEALLAGHGGELRRGMRARGLSTVDGRVTGVRVIADGGSETEVVADAVVVADGGFAGNAELVERYISPAPEKLCRRGAGTGLGDGMLMAKEAGARLAHMDRFYGHVQCAEAVRDDALWPYPILDLVASSALVVGPDGRRFADEGLGGVAMANAIAALPDPLSAFVVMDSNVWEGKGRDFLLPPNPTLVERGVTLYSAPDVAGLAELIGVPADALQTTVTDFEEARAGQRLDLLDPPRTSAPSTLASGADPIRTPPFLAIRLAAGITYTMGGIVIDTGARALREDGTAVRGLYAAGSATTGFEGGPRSVYLGGLAKAAIFGLRAAETVVRDIAATAGVL